MTGRAEWPIFDPGDWTGITYRWMGGGAVDVLVDGRRTETILLGPADRTQRGAERVAAARHARFLGDATGTRRPPD
jgi:hypothetical protein